MNNIFLKNFDGAIFMNNHRAGLLVLIALFIPIFSGNLLAQGGSNYSIFGIGDIKESSNSVADGLGGASVALISPYSVNNVNPATWNFVKTTRLQTGFDFRQIQSSDGKTSFAQNNGKLQGISALFAIDTTSGISASFGFQPYSSVNYLSAREQKLVIEGTEITATAEYAGKGGLSTVWLGGAFRPTDNLSLGAAIRYHFGRITSSVTTSFSDTKYYPSQILTTDDFGGTSFQAGLIYTGISNLTLGATFSAGGKLSVENELHHVSALIADTSFTSSVETNLPTTLGLGAAYTSGKFMIIGDVMSSDFSSFSYRSGLQTSFRRSNRVSLGVSRLANFAPDAEPLDRWAYNFGVGYQQLYYQMNGTGINEMYASVGMQIPVAGQSRIDLALSSGMRGTTENGLYREIFGRFSFSVSIGETWFKPFKRD